MNLNAVTPLNKRADYGFNAIRTERDTEYDAFSRITFALRTAAQGDDPHQVIQAVHANTELWTILAADLMQPGNALADEIKAGLLSLANFSIKHGHAVMNGATEIGVLIDINISIMKGLRGEVPK